MSCSANRILGFDGLRAVAFLLVFVGHKFPNSYTGAYGMVAVWIFFVLSGFLITRILARARERIEKGETTFKAALIDFYIRRTGRIFPPYYTLLIVIAFLAALGLVDLGARSAFLANWFFLSNVYIETRWWPVALGHLWSLSVEEQYYLIFAPLALAAPRERLGMVCIVMMGFGVAVDIAAYLLGANFITFSVDSILNFALFAVGGLAGLSTRPLPSWLKTASAIRINVALIGILPFLMVDPDDQFLLTHGRPLGLLFALLLLQIAQDQSITLVGALDWAPLRRLGLISYGAYLYHYAISSGSILSHLGMEPSLWLTMPMDFVLTLIAASASYRYLERPIRDWSKQIADGRIKSPRPAQATDASAPLG